MKPNFSLKDFEKLINTPEAKQSLENALKDNAPNDNYYAFKDLNILISQSKDNSGHFDTSDIMYHSDKYTEYKNNYYMSTSENSGDVA